MVGALELPFAQRYQDLQRSAGKSTLIESKGDSVASPAPKRRCRCIDRCLRPAGMVHGCAQHLASFIDGTHEKILQPPPPHEPPKRTPITIPIPSGIDAQRFWRKVVRSPGCWEWKAGTQPEGYGRFKIGGRLYSAHRVAYTLAKGPIPVGEGYHGIEVMHSCDNPRCCRPDHLVLGTNQDNAKDMAAKRRNHIPRGERRTSNSADLLTPGSQSRDWVGGRAWR